MRVALNIVFGLLLLVMQSLAVVAPHTIAEAVPCRCCSCGSKACSTPQTTPAPTPSPLAVQRVFNNSEKVSRPVLQPIIERAALRPEPSLFSAAFVSSLTGRPLYERFCALLI